MEVKLKIGSDTELMLCEKNMINNLPHEINVKLSQTLVSQLSDALTNTPNKRYNIENVHHEKEELNGEIENLRKEVQRLQTVHDASVNEVRALKHQLDERIFVANNIPSVVDESFQLVKQPTPSLSPIVVDIRAEH